MSPKSPVSFLSALLVLFFASGAFAAPSSMDPPPRDLGVERPILLAQNGDVDIFYDADGNRVILDAFTGEVIAIERRRPLRRDEARPLPRLRDSGVLTARPGEADPAAVERYRRYRESQLGLREPPGVGGLYERDGYGYRRDAYGDRYEPFPEEPPADIVRRPLPGERGAPERQPLPDNPVTGSTPPPDQRVAPPAPARQGASQEVAHLQVLLDRLGVSPGVIDGRIGGNVNKALDAYAEMTGKRLDLYDSALVERMLQETGGPAFTTYTITPEDAAAHFVASVPEDYGEKAKLERLSYTSVAEKLAERFHMDEAYLKALNPGVDFSRPGTQLTVADPGKPKTGEVARIVADKGREQVRAYDAEGKLLVAYPATIGSAATPSPSGTVKIERIALNPEYTYNPKINFQQGNNDRVLRIPPGPNGPVGTVWIALSKPTYGIHGTPEPSRIGKTNSNGCIRLTNWDAEELAGMVKPGVWVQFID
jgi:lipoprotein-anchoring transpeptidase ErfK/SrfK